MLKRANLALFAIKAAASLIALSLLWPFIAPHYDWLLAIAIKIVPDFSLMLDGGDLYIQIGGQPVAGVHASALHFGLLLLLSLFVATPGLRPWLRLRLAGIGLVTTFAIQLFELVLLARMGTSSATLALPQILLSNVGFDLLPPLVWLGLCLRCSFQPKSKTESEVLGGPELTKGQLQRRA